MVLADEPTGALDSKSARQLLETFEHLNQNLGATILMVTHDAFTASYADRIIFIKDGKVFNELVKGEDTRKQFFEKIIEVQTLLGGGKNTNVFSKDACIKTCIYFAVMYLAVMIFNTLTISRYKLINLLTAVRKNEKVKIKNPIISILIFLISAGLLGYAYYLVTGGVYEFGITMIMKFIMKMEKKRFYI